MPIESNVYFSVTSRRLEKFAADLKDFVRQGGDQIVESPNNADLIIEVREADQAAGGTGKYNIGTVTDAAIGDRAIKIGNVSGGDLNIAMDNAQQQISRSTGLASDQKAELTQLVALMEAALKYAENKEAPTAVKAVAEETGKIVTEVTEPKAPAGSPPISGEGLIKAAKNLAATMPFVLPIANEIVNMIARMQR